MNKLLLTLCLQAVLIQLSGQSPKWEWATKINSTAHQSATDMCVDKGNNILYITGYNKGTVTVSNTVLDTGSFFAKYDLSGNTLWAKNCPSLLADIKTDSIGNVFLLGNFTGTLRVLNDSLVSVGDQDIYLLKYNSAGTLIWMRSYGSPAADQGNALVIGSAGEPHFTGAFGDSLQIGNDQLSAGNAFIAKVNASGTPLWARDVTIDSVYLGPGHCITLDKFNNVYVAGNLYYGCMFCTDGFIAKYTTTGTPALVKKISDYNPSKILTDDLLNVYLVVGEHPSNHGSGRMVLNKYTHQFKLLWATTLANASSGWSRNLTLSSGLVFDRHGDILMAGAYGGMRHSHDSLFLGSQFIEISGGVDLIVAKINHFNGTYLWTKIAGGKGREGDNFGGSYNGEMDVDKDGNAYLTGNFNYSYPPNFMSPPFDTCFFDNHMLINDGSWQQLFLAKLAPDNSVDISEVLDKNNPIKVYPNPTTGKFSYQINSSGERYQLRVYDILGKVIFSDLNYSIENVIDLTGQQKGIYILEMKSNLKSYQTKLVIE